MTERYNLAIGRIGAITEEKEAPAPFLDYFERTAAFLMLLDETYQTVASGRLYEMDLPSLQELNRKLYADILPDAYEESYADPAYAARMMKSGGADPQYGQILSFLYAELRGLIPYVFEKRTDLMVLFFELFIEIYDLFVLRENGIPDTGTILESLYWFESDNCDVLIPDRLDEQIDPAHDFLRKIVDGSDLSDLRYLYWYGDPISDNEIGIAKHLLQMKQEEINDLASVFTEGYRMGFVNSNKDLSKKSTAEICFPIGMERMVKASLPLFEKMGLKTTMRRDSVFVLYKRGGYRLGCFATSPNRQYDFDHREDEGLFLDKDFVNRKVSVLKNAFMQRRDLARKHAGPAVIETFGQVPFDPVVKPEAVVLNEKQQKLAVEYADQSGRISNEFIIGKERSFTVISFPCPEIGEQFAKIFAETVKVNTLDYKHYEQMQQALIDVLDTATHVRVKGKGKNRTDITVALTELKDPAEETLFENCVADVNIPVGEVFTSPKLAGTNGTLHVSEVYLAGLKYTDLCMTFEDGMVKDYTCKNFDREADNKKYIKDNILFHHDTLPIGEFAIGTNTTAYRMAIIYHIQERLDILIAEKTGPHFAVGDTCYMYDEDLVTCNPDGKRIIARENEISAKRKEDPGAAYFHCHTDITIPYNELGEIVAVSADGREHALIKDGFFVLEGTDDLNVPLRELAEAE
ncbi:MAG: aminopeptidase [Lachnospiraceae bacterium]|nr:aminopeptidase [Lachnospiraceae bacterium]